MADRINPAEHLGRIIARAIGDGRRYWELLCLTSVLRNARTSRENSGEAAKKDRPLRIRCEHHWVVGPVSLMSAAG